MPDRLRIPVRAARVSGSLIVVDLLGVRAVSRAQAASGESGVTVPAAPLPQATATIDPAFLQQEPSGFPFSVSSIVLVAIIAVVVVAAIVNVRGKARP